MPVQQFNVYWYESVKPLQYYCSCLPVSILLPMKKLLFWKKMSCSGSLILCRLAKCCDASIFALAAKFHLEPLQSSFILVILFALMLRVLKTAFGFIFCIKLMMMVNWHIHGVKVD